MFTVAIIQSKENLTAIYNYIFVRFSKMLSNLVPICVNIDARKKTRVCEGTKYVAIASVVMKISNFTQTTAVR
jgi:hypothetical protein